ncbi:calmodulin-like 3, partial [Entomortierella beljakovae]
MADRFNDAQLAEFKEVFSLYDKDNSGTISTSEIGSILRKFNPGITEASIQTMVRALDVDGSGTIDFLEFLTLMTRNSAKTDYDTELKEAFKVFDKDGNGFISRSELSHALSNLGSTLTEEEVDAMIQEADINGDGQVNYEEFALIMAG